LNGRLDYGLNSFHLLHKFSQVHDFVDCFVKEEVNFLRYLGHVVGHCDLRVVVSCHDSKKNDCRLQHFVKEVDHYPNSKEQQTPLPLSLFSVPSLWPLAPNPHPNCEKRRLAYLNFSFDSIKMYFASFMM